MCEGELTQTRSRFDMELSESAYLQIVEKKTASLFAAAAQLGARLAGAPDDQADTFRRFGLNLGMAFQITDDCLDIVGREDIVGKSLGTDLGKGKLTLPVIRLLQRLSAEEREDVCRLARDGFPEHRRPPFRERIRSHGAIESALATARSFIVDAVALLNSVPHSPAQRSLSGLGDYVIARSS
jgi:octaprenyl-diphosphate synthase